MGAPIKNPTILDEIQAPFPHDLLVKRPEVEHLRLDRDWAASDKQWGSFSAALRGLVAQINL